MTTVAEVRMWGRRIGAVALEAESEVASFQYDRAFAGSGINVAPLMMPLHARVYRFPELPRPAFHGLPGMLADVLPDRFGNALIDAWLARQGRTPADFNAVERLCYTGARGMGALEFEPAAGPDATASATIEIDALVDLASAILTERATFQTSFDGDDPRHAMQEILRVGTSAGGARAKAVIAWNRTTNEVRSGQVPAEDGFEPWLMKFDGVSGNRDRELDDPQGYGAIEYAYHLMAEAAGIAMTECRLFEENERRHFMTRRFDRTAGGGKRHLQSLGALAHLDFNAAGAHAYEQAFLVIRELGLGDDAVRQQFRRMVFNVAARNQDDHVKNIAFLMDQDGTWSLAPAFDVTYAYNPSGAWTARHQMTINGKRDGFTDDDLLACGAVAGVRGAEARAMIDDVRAAVRDWPEYAERAAVEPRWIELITRALRV